MDQVKFFAQLENLANEAASSTDPVVRRAAAVLCTLRASSLAGEPFFNALVDEVGAISRRQRDILLGMNR